MDNLQLFAVTEAGSERVALPEDTISIDDLYGELALGVYSALRTFSHNRFLCLDEHLARTKRSMALLGWSYQFDEISLRRALHQACTGYPLPDARVRFDVLAEPARRLGTESRVLIALRPFEPVSSHAYAQGVSVGFAPGLSRERPQAKMADFAMKRHHYSVDHPNPVVYEYLITDEAGHILEGTGSNFFGVRKGVVFTAGDGVLEGITREIILSLLPELNILLRLEPIHSDEIAELDEAGMSSSSRALLPVVEIEGQVIGDGRPGPICQRILVAYNEFVARKIKTAVDK
jgi:branched-chain amino acid aminotransferase